MNPASQVVSGASAFVVAVLSTALVLAAEPSPPSAEHVNYGRPFEPPTRPALIALPAGAVEPTGWLRDWCLAAKDGFTGHMDDYHVAFKQAWAADYTMTGENLAWPKGAWPYEGGGYWFDGLVRLGYILHDDALIQQAKRRYDAVVSHINPNSLLFLWWLDKNNPEHRKAASVDGYWSLWACGLLGRGMAAYYATSHDERVLQAMEAVYSGNPDALRQEWGVSNPWPAFNTYTWTGNKEIAAALSTLYPQDGGKIAGPNPANRYHRMPNQEPGAEKNDHVVGFLESATPWALGYLWKSDDVVRLRFPMSASVQTGRDRNANDAPYGTISYGPLLFALPIRDVDGPNNPDPAAKWSYVLDVQPDKLASNITVERQAMPAQWDWPLAAPLKLRANAVPCPWTPEPKSPLPTLPIVTQEPSEKITLIPYGCTKFRVSMFPVTERTLQPPATEKPR